MPLYMPRPTYVSMADLGCACKGKLGEVDCGGECGGRIYDDPDRLLPLSFPTIGQPVPPLDNVTPGTDQGPQNNDWATDGMGDLVDTFNALSTPVKMGVFAALVGLGYLAGKKFKKR